MPVTSAALHDAFRLGWTVLELRCRIAVAATTPDAKLGSSIRLSSVWHAAFARAATILSTAFPNATTAGTIYEPASREALPYLYSDSGPDYANVGIAALDAAGTPLLPEFKLYDVTRRAINCLSILYVRLAESLVPETIRSYQSTLTDATLGAPPQQGEDPTIMSSSPQPDQVKHRITNQAVKLLEAWDGYIREHYFAGGRVADNDLELIAYEAGRAMASLSWGISRRTLLLDPKDGEAFSAMWREVFRAEDVIRLQHQLNALSSALDDAYREEHKNDARPDPSVGPGNASPPLPSQSISSVTRSLDYWQRAVHWLCAEKGWRHEDHETTSAETAAIDKAAAGWEPPAVTDTHKPVENDDKRSWDVATWSNEMRVKLIEQGDIWQNLVTGQQNLGAFTAEKVTQAIMQDVAKRLVAMVREDLPKALQSAREAARSVTEEVTKQTKEALDAVRRTASGGWETLAGSLKPWLVAIVAVGVGVVILVAAYAVANPPEAKLATSGSFLTAALSAIGGWLGLRRVDKARIEAQTEIAAKTEEAKEKVDETHASTISQVQETGKNLLRRVETAAQSAAGEIVKAFERAYTQVGVELKVLGYGIAVSYPLLEFFVVRFDLESEEHFVTHVLWTGQDRAKEVERIAKAALGPLASLTGLFPD